MGSRNFQLLEVRDTQASTGVGSGAFQVQGGGYFGGNSFFNNNISISGNNSFASGYGSFMTLAYAGSASSTTGAIVSAGGAYFGDNTMIDGTLTITGTASTVVLQGTQNATSSTTGAFLCSGGINVAKNAIVVGEMGTYTYLGGSYLLTFSAAGGFTFSGGISATQGTGAMQIGYCGGSRYQGYFTTPTMVSGNVNTGSFTATFPMTFQQVAISGGGWWTAAAFANVSVGMAAFTNASSNGVVIRYAKSSATGFTGNRPLLQVNLVI
jgi:hypothetical protein